MSKPNSSSGISLDSAYNIARECVELVCSISACGELIKRGRLKAEKGVGGIAEILEKLRRLVEEAETISPEMKAEFALDGEVVSLTGCSVHGAGACDAGIELASWLLARVDSSAYNQELQEISAWHEISAEKKVPYVALYALRSLRHTELQQLRKQMELKWGIARRNRMLASKANDPKTRRRKPKRKTDPKDAERRAEREEQQKQDKAVFKDWYKGQWGTYEDYAMWKNEYLPKGWKKLTEKDVQSIIHRHKARLKRQGKWPPDEPSK